MRASTLLAIFILIQGDVFAQSASADDHIDEYVEEAAVRIAEVAFERSGNAMTELLIGQGLSHQDSEVIARGFIDGMVSCLVDAALSEARDQSVSPREVMAAFEEAIEGGDVPDPDIIDIDRVDARAEHCAFVEFERAGVSMDMFAPQPRTSEER